MNGTCLSFSKQLEEKGFVTKNTQKDGSIKMTGDFAGKKDVQTIIGPVSETNNTIKTITLLIPCSTGTWDELTDKFNHYKKYYIIKYGEPTELSEKGTGEDYRSIADLKKGICKYYAYWLTYNGTINITFQFISSVPNIIITYTDKNANELAESEVINDI